MLDSVYLYIDVNIQYGSCIFFKLCLINSKQTEQHLIKEIACKNMVSLCIS